MTTAHASAARIGAAIRRHMIDPDWAWRSTDPDPCDLIEIAAVSRLRDQRDRACRWIELAAEALGTPMASGNGSGGPWQRSAVIDVDGRLGIADIARGTVTWTDAIVPSYVQRFAVPAGSAISTNAAGGSGSIGSAVAQVCLVYGMHSAGKVRISPLPRPSISWVEWGLTTCYGTVGATPETTVELRETTIPQWDSVRPVKGHCSVEIATIAMDACRGWRSVWAQIEVREGAVHHAGCRGHAEWRILGTREQREQSSVVLLQSHAVVAEIYCEDANARARAEAGIGRLPRSKLHRLDYCRAVAQAMRDNA